MRVDQRKFYGGHDVEKSIIEYNFNEGIKRMQQNLHLFDNITFVDGNSNFGEIAAIISRNLPNMKLPNIPIVGSMSFLKKHSIIYKIKFSR